MPLPSDPWHALGADEALRRSGGDAVGGLSDDEVSRRRAAHEAGASVIAMGTHGRGRSLHLFLGSVALGTVERSDLPVILCGQ